MVTRLRGIQSSVVADPTKKSASYVPAQPALLFSLRSTDEGRGVFPGRTLLANPVAKRYVNPRELGFVPPVVVVPTPRIYIDATGEDFADDGEALYTFSGVPPATVFEAIIIGGSNLADIKVVSIYDLTPGSRDLMGSTTISITPAWTGSTFTADANAPTLVKAAGGFPTASPVLTFSSVPLVSGLAVSVSGIAPP
jgi:hypothetical protein